jgi:hypothetical protein
MPERTMSQLVRLMLLMVLLAGCAAGLHESFFQVKGSLADRAPAGGECVLQLHAQESSRVVDYRSIGARFETEFVIPAGEAPYYFTAKCPGGTSYRSRIYQLGRSEDFKAMIDLGEMQPAQIQAPN